MKINLYHSERINIIALIFIFCFAVLGLAFWYIQIIKGEYYRELSKNNRIRRVRLPAPRGKIFDASGAVLADNRPGYNIMLDIEEVANIELLAQKLSKLLRVDKSVLVSNIKSKNRLPFMPAVAAADVTLEQLTRLEEDINELPGVFVTVEPIRNYKYSDLTAHVLGYVGKIDQAELEALKSERYHFQDYIGKAGIEKQYDAYLRGEAGGMQVQVDYRGRLDEVITKKVPVPGNDLYLTIDIEAQKALEEAYRNHTGAGVVLRAKTGEVLAMLSKPAYDPNIFVDSGRSKEAVKILKDPAHPLINKAVSLESAPGSVFKVLVAIAALNTGIISSDTKFLCEGFYNLNGAIFRCWWEPGHKWMDVLNAIKHSCNVYFYNIGLKLEMDKLAQTARMFGLGRVLGIDLPGEKKGLVPTSDWKKKKWKQPWYAGDTLNVSIGQGYILVTPLQLASMMGVVANGAFLMKPHVLKKIVSVSGSHVIKTQIKYIDRIVCENNIMDLIRDGMFQVVNTERGTGKRAALKKVRVSGKTGTVQLTRGEKGIKHAWFAGYAPSSEPEIAFAFFVEQAETGGRTAAPLAGTFLSLYFKDQKVSVPNSGPIEGVGE